MPRLELELSAEVYALWQRFLGTTPAGRLQEAGLLGDWVALGFMANVERFLKQGAPDLPAPDMEAIRQQEDAEARKRLTKPQRRVLPMFNENDCVSVAEVSRVLGLAEDQGQAQVQAWLAEDFLAPGPERQGQPTYVLSSQWQVRNLAANRPSLNVPRVPHLMKPVRLEPEEK